MKRYKLIANDENTHESTQLGIIIANSIREAALFLAYHFPQHYYSANIIQVNDDESNRGDFLAIACSEYYRNEFDGILPSPIELALQSYINDMKRENDIFNLVQDYSHHDASVVYQYWKSIKSVNGKIVSANKEDM